MIGKMSDKLLEACLDALPLEITVLDADDRVVAWTHAHDRIFARDESVLGRDVRACHSPASRGRIDTILSSMKAGTRDDATSWIDQDMPAGGTHKVLVIYRALRDETGRYVGCVETTQDIAWIQTLSGEKKQAD